jgi:baculoviral IAP repeat-containing protein 6 (apollon)
MEFEIADDILNDSNMLSSIQQQAILLQIQYDWDNIKSINLCDNTVDIMLDIDFQENIIQFLLKITNGIDPTFIMLMTKAEDMVIVVDYEELDKIINEINKKIELNDQLEQILNIINDFFTINNENVSIENDSIENYSIENNIDSDCADDEKSEIEDESQFISSDDETEDDQSVDFNSGFHEDVYQEFYEENILERNELILQCEQQKVLEKKAIEIFDDEKNRRSELKNKTFNRDEIIQIIFNELSSIDIFDINKICVKPEDNNIFKWIVKMNSFSHDSNLYHDLKSLKKMGYDSNVVISIDINPILYPYYPPTVKILKPMFKKGLSYGISNMDYFNPNKWNPTNSMKLTIKSIYDIIELYGRIDIDNIKGSETDLNNISMMHTNLEQLSIKTGVSSLSVIEVNRYHIDYVPMNSSQSNGNNDTNGKYWKAGTGFGFGKSDGWDVKEYITSEEEKNVQITNLLASIIEILKTVDDINVYYNCISESCLIPVINEYIEGCSILELDKKKDLYRLIYDIINLMINPTYIKLLNNVEVKSTYKILSKVYDESITYRNSIQKMSNKSLDSDMIGIIEYIIDTYDKMTFLILTLNEQLETITDKSSYQQLSIEELYVKELKEEQYGTMNVIKSGYHYKNEIEKSITSLSVQRVMKEITSFTRDTLPLSFSSTIAVRVDSNNINAMKCMITGPDNTPYHGGCFLFDIMMPNTYPNNSPKFNLATTGGGSVRFNPNLYNCGKVCLSLLGTWQGHSSESWIPEKSTLIQVFVSIQSLILVEDPYFNEPSYESSMHTEKGKQKSFKYNDSIRYSTVKWAIIDQIRHPKAGFETMIKKHFYYRKDSIIKEVTKWVEETHVDGFKGLFDELKMELEKIKL